MKRYSAALLGVSLMIASPAMASDLLGRGSSKDAPAGYEASNPDWRGFGASVGAGTTFGNIEIEAGGVSLFDGIGYDGVLVDANAWYYAQLGNFVIGPAIGGQYGTVALQTVLGDVEMDYRIYGDLHFGVAHGNTLFYGLIGVSQTHVALDIAKFEEDITGFRVGGGIKHQRPNGWLLGLDVVYTDHEDQKFGPVNLAPEDVTATFRTGVQF